MAKKSPLVVVRLSQSLKNVDSFEVPPIVWSLLLNWSWKINWALEFDEFNKFWTVQNGSNTKKWSASRNWRNPTSEPDVNSPTNIYTGTINGATSFFPTRKKFNLDGPDGWACYWHDLRNEEIIFSKRQSGGGSVMIWGAIGYQNKSDLTFVDTRMKAVDYQRMIALHLPAYGDYLAGPGWKFQQDNAPVHVAR